MRGANEGGAVLVMIVGGTAAGGGMSLCVCVREREGEREREREWRPGMQGGNAAQM